MESIITVETSSSLPPCSPDEVAISPGDCVEADEEWLENEALAGFRVWQLAGIILSILLTITIAFCCCVRFRIPRTKQDIEADHIRKRIAKSFRKELAKISNTDMDELDLRKALDRVRMDLGEVVYDEEMQKQRQQTNLIEPAHDGMRARFRAVFHRFLRTSFTEISSNPN